MNETINWTECPAGAECTNAYAIETGGYLSLNVQEPDGFELTIESVGRVEQMSGSSGSDMRRFPTPVTRYHLCRPSDLPTQQTTTLTPGNGVTLNFRVLTRIGDMNLEAALTSHGLAIVSAQHKARFELEPIYTLFTTPRREK